MTKLFCSNNAKTGCHSYTYAAMGQICLLQHLVLFSLNGFDLEKPWIRGMGMSDGCHQESGE